MAIMGVVVVDTMAFIMATVVVTTTVAAMAMAMVVAMATTASTMTKILTMDKINDILWHCYYYSIIVFMVHVYVLVLLVL